MADLTDVVPVAMPIIQKVAAVYLKHTSPWFIGLIVHGSAVKGGFIPGCSDIDFQLFLDDAAFTWYGELALEVGFSIQRDLRKMIRLLLDTFSVMLEKLSSRITLSVLYRVPTV